MVLCGIVVYFVDWDSGVNDTWLDFLLLNNWLDSLVDMVMNMLTTDSGGSTLALCGVVNNTFVTELVLLVYQSTLGVIAVAVVELSVLDSAQFGSVLLWQNLTVLNRLDSSVIVILVHLLVNGCLNILMLMRLDSLVCDARSYRLMDGCVVVTSLLHEVADCCLSLVHDFDVK